MKFLKNPQTTIAFFFKIKAHSADLNSVDTSLLFHFKGVIFLKDNKGKSKPVFLVSPKTAENLAIFLRSHFSTKQKKTLDQTDGFVDLGKVHN